jgi:hypothetical protein
MAAPPKKPPGVEKDDEPQPLEKDCPADAYFYRFLLSLFDRKRKINK